MKQAVYFISHGGGPWPWIEQWAEDYAGLRQSLEHIATELPEKPKAILMISAHWITQGHLAIMHQPQPKMLYDYYGFPEHTYHIQYPAPSDPLLAEYIQNKLEQAHFSVIKDTERGFDHGAFVPLALAFPDANIPVIQLSIERHFDPAYHIRLGEALASLREEGILIIASGLSFHNMRLFNAHGTQPSKEFDQWLRNALSQESNDRKEALIHWETAPSARIAHATEDHLIPLMVAIGAAGNDMVEINYHEDNVMGGVTVSSFKFG
ncbi:aromatic ring-cleaving dioxygenase [Pelistega indica]|uniref:Aromatic ring-cleaving dioxygenase n=1 Tax=Pelistega indica TaxID=1414851 RepID=V8FWR7_9BURK|nr:class III extradiol ring-cleavage dioxygenase [Pelistega indica]ETD68590.1 aromatic ring-cleaving dioxygenase [Pelistega indica]